MKPARSVCGVVILAVLFCSTSAGAESAAEAFKRGKTLLVRGDFQGALGAYAAAARADRANREYLGQYMLVRQAMEIRGRLKTERDPGRWERLARSLHHFYGGQGLYSEVLSLDRRIHARLKTASSAVMLAETELAMGLEAEAVKTLSGLAAADATASSQALLGIALARQGKMPQARRIAERVALPKDTGPGTTYSVARLQAAVGNSPGALRLLARCFESVAPSGLEGFKKHARQSPDFTKLASTAEFAAVLKTESKVPESKCSGGSKCAGCPMRGQCSGSAGH